MPIGRAALANFASKHFFISGSFVIPLFRYSGVFRVLQRFPCRQAGDSRLFRYLESNCISDLSLFLLTTLRTSLREPLQLHFKNMVLVIKAGDSLTDVQWLLYLQIMVVMAYSLIQTGGTP